MEAPLESPIPSGTTSPHLAVRGRVRGRTKAASLVPVQGLGLAPELAAARHLCLAME